MIHRCRRSLLLSVCAALIVPALIAAPLSAQTPSSRPATNTMVPAYDLSKEIRVQGVIEKINGFGNSGPIGTHILIQTASGVVDAHLGFGSAVSSRNLGISVGQNVTIVGMMEKVDSSSVLMARILTTPSRVVVLRNEHGIPIRGTTHRGAQARVSYSADFGGAVSATNSSAEAQHGGL